MMQIGKINKPISGFQAQRQILILFLQSQPWEIPFNWDYGFDRDAIDPIDQIVSGIEKYLPFKVEDVEVTGDGVPPRELRVSINLEGKKFDVSI